MDLTSLFGGTGEPVNRFLRVQHRSVQQRPDGAHGQSLFIQDSPRSHRRRSRSIHRRIADTRRSRAPPILVEWNDTVAENYAKDKCIHQLFEQQVERTPSAIALEFEDKRITYQELNRRANQLAHYLISLGIGPEKMVGICVERSIEMVVGLLGILKAGGAYVPLDPAYPKERLHFMLEDSQVSVLLTQETLVEDGEWRIEDSDPRSSILDPRLKVVKLDRDLTIIERQSCENPTTQIDSHNLAYVIYTSGSTGTPKGVQIEHRSVVNCLCLLVARLTFRGETDGWPSRRYPSTFLHSASICQLDHRCENSSGGDRR